MWERVLWKFYEVFFLGCWFLLWLIDVYINDLNLKRKEKVIINLNINLMLNILGKLYVIYFVNFWKSIEFGNYS